MILVTFRSDALPQKGRSAKAAKPSSPIYRPDSRPPGPIHDPSPTDTTRDDGSGNNHFDQGFLADGLSAGRGNTTLPKGRSFKQMYPQSLASEKLRFLSFGLDNRDTEQLILQSRKLRSLQIRPSVYSLDGLESLLADNNGNVVFFVGHIEKGEFVRRDVSGRRQGESVKLIQLEASARRHNVSPVFLGCESACSVPLGVQGEIKSTTTLELIARAADQPTVGEFLEVLRHDLLLRVEFQTSKELAMLLQIVIYDSISGKKTAVLLLPNPCADFDSENCSDSIKPATTRSNQDVPYSTTIKIKSASSRIIDMGGRDDSSL